MISDIITPILGGAIGYFTNWLAIKMLFLPHEPKYIGKFKVPFTPGLIPKEREKLAKKIALVTEENVLNKETIEKNLFCEENKEKIYLLVEKNFYKLKDKNYTIDDLLDILYKDEKNNIINNIENRLLFYIKNFLEDRKNKKILSDAIVEKLYFYINNLDKNEEIKEKLEKIIINIFNNENVKNSIYNIKLCDIIDDEAISNIKMTIFENIPKICEIISKKIETDEQLNEKMSIFIKNVIEDNVNSFAGLFLNTDKVYNSIKKNILAYLNNKENQSIIGLKIFEFISIYQNKTLLDIYNKIPEKSKNIIKEKCNNENLKKYINKTNILDNIFNIINDENLKQNINKIVSNIINEKLSNYIYLYLEKYIKNNKHKILNININCILDKINICYFKDRIFNIIEKFIDREGHKILSSISVSKMIEEKINSFDMETIENLIVSVTKKELNAITIIGGVLGFIIGLIPVILN